MAQTIQIRRGTGSAVPSSLAAGELAINVDSGKFYYGNGSAVSSDFRVDSITAENYIVCSSVSNITTQTLSGSTAFGDSADDTHQFIGNMRVTGLVSASNNIFGAHLNLHGAGGDPIITFGTNDDKIYQTSNTIIIAPDDTDILTVSDQGLNVQVDGNLKVTSHITASGNISASGHIFAEEIHIDNQEAIASNNDYLLINESGLFSGGVSINRSNMTLPITMYGAVTASSHISASGTIFTDTLSSPGNSLSIPSNTVTITAGTAGDANLILQADTDNNDEADNPFMLFEQDGGGIRSIIGHAGGDNEYPDATTFTGGKGNHLIIAHSGSGASRGIQFGTGNNARVTIDTDGNVGIGTNAPGEKLEVIGDISASGQIFTTRVFVDQVQALEIAGDVATLFGGFASNKISLGKGNQTPSIFTNGAITASGAISSSGTITADKVVSDNIQSGWHGSTTRIKILVSDFIPDDVGRPAMIDDTGSDRWLESHSTGKLFASIPIPTGFKATHVHIYGSGTSALEVYEADINSKTVTSKGTGNIGTELDITDVTSDTTNYLLLELAQASGEEVYGGYVTIEAV